MLERNCFKELSDDVIIYIFSFLSAQQVLTTFPKLNRHFYLLFYTKNATQFHTSFLWQTLYNNRWKSIKKIHLPETIQDADWRSKYEYAIKCYYRCRLCGRGSIEQRRQKQLIKSCKCFGFAHSECIDQQRQITPSRAIRCVYCGQYYELELRNRANVIKYVYTPMMAYFVEYSLALLGAFVIAMCISLFFGILLYPDADFVTQLWGGAKSVNLIVGVITEICIIIATMFRGDVYSGSGDNLEATAHVYGIFAWIVILASGVYFIKVPLDSRYYARIRNNYRVVEKRYLDCL